MGAVTLSEQPAASPVDALAQTCGTAARQRHRTDAIQRSLSVTPSAWLRLLHFSSQKNLPISAAQL